MSRFGSIDTQYFDASGKPLSGGFLYFYESGTNTDKTTYSDADQTVPNAQPVVLEADGRQGDIYFNGSAKCVLTDSLGATIDTLDPVGASISRDAFAPWNALLTYSIEDIVQGSDDAYYQSNLNSNLANDPTSSPTKWQEVRFISVWNADYTYPSGAMAIVGGGAFYRCINGGSLNDPPASTPAEWSLVGGSGMNDIIEDTTPSLGGPLDTNTQAIISTAASNNDIDITPDGTGETNITRPTVIGELTLPGTWTMDIVANDIVLSFGGATVLKFTSTGAIVAEGDITAFGTVA